MHLANMNWPAVRALSRDTPVVIPIAALEQHGAHLPLFTDSLLCGEIARRAEERLGDRVLFAPLQWLGNSDHHLDFPGTLSAAPRPYLDLLVGLMENFIGHGFRRLVFLNGHGGNDVPGRQAVFELRQRHRARNDLLLLCATYWSLGGRPWEVEPTLVQRQMGHACEWETSMILRIAPQVVGPLETLAEVPPGGGFEPGRHGRVSCTCTLYHYNPNPGIRACQPAGFPGRG
jgi:creatinine amidohydrolase